MTGRTKDLIITEYNMAYINEKGEIETTQEDRESLSGKQSNMSKNIMNYIIWGDKKHYYDKPEVDTSF